MSCGETGGQPGFRPHGTWGNRLVVPDYFLNEDTFGKVHHEGDHKGHVIKVKRNTLELDTRFNLDFNTAFPSGPARPHGIATK